MNIIDRIINFFSPCSAAKRLRAHAMVKNTYANNKLAFPRRRIISGGLALSGRENQSADFHDQNSNEVATFNIPVYQQSEQPYPVPQEDDPSDGQCPAMPINSPQEGDRGRDFRPQKGRTVFLL